MRLLILAPFALLPAASAAAPVADAPPAMAEPAGTMPVLDPGDGMAKECPPISRYHAAKRGGALGLRNLAELPGADHYKAAYRRIDGCVAPIIVGFGVGGQR